MLFLADVLHFSDTDNCYCICLTVTHGRFNDLIQYFMAALCNRAGHIYFHPVVSYFFFFFSSLNLRGRRLDVYHTSTHGAALV